MVSSCSLQLKNRDGTRYFRWYSYKGSSTGPIELGVRAGCDNPLTITSDLLGNRIDGCHRRWSSAAMESRFCVAHHQEPSGLTIENAVLEAGSLRVSATQHPGMCSLPPSLPPQGKRLPRTILLPSPNPGQACCHSSLRQDEKDYE